MKSAQIIIVGGGLAGLSAALELEGLGYSPILFEGSNQIGGRVRTEKFQGFLLDIGFQILLSSYPEIPQPCKTSLKLGAFKKGAYYHTDNKWAFINPASFWRWQPGASRGLIALGKALLTTNLETISQDTETFIHNMGAPEDWISDFLSPFLRGIFLDKHLETRASRFLQLLPLFIWGSPSLPARGMGALPAWYQSQLKTTEIRLKQSVVEVSPKEITLASGEKAAGDAVLLALSLPQLAKLIPHIDPGESRTTCSDYFAIKASHIQPEAYLRLDGRVESPVNHFAFLSAVQPAYAPKGMHLLSATAMGAHLPAPKSVHEYLSEELKIPIQQIQPLERKTVEHALPSQALGPPLRSRVLNDIFIAGEAVDPPSTNDAIRSGRLTAQETHHFLN